LANLIDNAVKYSPEGELVEVRATAVNGRVVVDVTDHGRGISPADQRLVFEKFGRVSSTSAKPGSGLGLYIPRAIAAAPGGRVEPLARLERLPQHLRLAHPVEAVAPRRVAVDVPRVHEPVRQTALDRVRLDRSRLDLHRVRLQVLELDEAMLIDRARELRNQVFLLADVRRRRLRERERAEGLLELRAHPVEGRMRTGG